MTSQDDFERTISYGENALSLIKRNQVSAFPRNYEFWYTYSAGFNIGLNKAINDILRDRGRITATDIDNIYAEYLSPRRIGEQIEDVGSQVSEEISQVISMIECSLAESTAYETSLNGANQKLSNTTDLSRIREIVKDLISANEENSGINKNLRTQLEESQRQITELQSNLEVIRFESLTDELTTLANRKHFDQSIDRALAKADETGEPLALLMTDIDHFKRFNDTYGHQTGDQVLRLVALAVKQNVKGQDIPCRYGGEEFSVILPRTHLRQAVTVAEHIRKSVMSKELIKRSTGEHLGRITISIGVALYHPGEGVADFIERTDQCMYAAKRTGRNKVLCETDPEVGEYRQAVA
ncbi:GGDEF domain-containing protein [Rhodobium orientis]|uniref:diguanylate cyclase n=1 Tax=Rhodobium orientis TaxID=34017 RepID=A0A327JRJ7_9HYPH|nr:GGDEF domain-containing protein [Rhodobium orientis]MBK5951513.1 GGDEF domain-containing protein [Rhodobium orientis]RAI29109.1 GGDEF domain-containing protein [Rhodobium orientis]